MVLEFSGESYTTIDDVKERFRVSAKTIRKWIQQGRVPEPPVVYVGTRRFRHFDEKWMEAFEAELMKAREQSSSR